MNDFKNWLKGQRLSASSIKEHIRTIQYFTNWCKFQGIKIEAVQYKDLLKYIKTAQEKGNSSGSINNNLNSIKKYFEYLNIGVNPAHKLTIKEGRRQTKYLSKEALEALYTSFTAQKDFREEKSKIAHQRDSIILGLMIYQAVDTATLKRLRIDHIDLNNGTIYLPETKKSNSRTIGLQSKQMLILIRYLAIVESDLLIARNGSRVVQDLFRKLKKINPVIENIYQIRGSVISSWLENSDLREVQYLAGHKHISSTEEYEKQNTDFLRKTLKAGHPLMG